MQVLRVWIPAAGLVDAEQLLEFAACDAWGETVETGQATLASLPAAGRLELVVPFERVLLTTVALPRQNRRQLLRVAPFALEERLLTPPDESHCALGEPSAGVWPVAVVERDWLQGVLAAVRAVRPVAAVWPAWYCLPVGTRWWQGSEAWYRSAVHQGEYLVAGLPAADDGVDVQAADMPLVRRAPDAQAINLLQGTLAAAPRPEGGRSPWRVTAALAVAVLVVWYGQLGWSVWQGKQETKALNGRLAKAFYQVFPASASMIDPVLQVERKLQEQQAGPAAAPPDDFLVMLQSASAFVAGRGPVSQVEYDSGELKIAVRAPASAADAMMVPARATGMTLESVPPAAPDAPLLLKLRRTEGGS